MSPEDEKRLQWIRQYEVSLDRRATVEQELWNVYNGKTEIPEREQFKKWAQQLGVPVEWLQLREKSNKDKK